MVMKLILLAKDRNAMNSKLYPENPYHIYYYQYQKPKTHMESFPGGKQFERQD